MPRWPKGHKKRTDRNYDKEAEAASRPDRVADRVRRNQARAKLEKEGLVHKGDGKEVDHKKPIGAGHKNDNSRSNLQVLSRSENRRKQPKRK